MISSRTRTGLHEARHKTSPITPKSSKSSKTGSKSEHEPSSIQSERHSVDRSPRSVESRPRSIESKLSDRRSPKISTPEKRVVRGSELQSQLDVAMEDLRKSKELLEKAQLEKSKAIADLKEAKKEADDANLKLSEALVLQKRAEENLEIEKFRAVELEQASIDAAQKIKHKWQSEIELVKEKHSAELSALFAANLEVDRIKQELAMVTEVKNSALMHAENAMQIAEENAKKVEVLSCELVHMREALDATCASQLAASEEKALIDAMWESKAKEASEFAAKLGTEVESLKQELVKAKMAEDKFVQTEEMIEKLKTEMSDSRQAESNAVDIATECKRKAKLLEAEVGKAKSAEKAANEYVDSLLKQIEESNKFLQEAEDEIVLLKGSLESLEMSLGKQQGDLERSDLQIEAAKLEADSMTKTIESLRKEVERMEEEKARAYENGKAAALEIQTLMEEKTMLCDELQVAKEEEEMSKNAMDGLALALSEVSSETKKAKESLHITQDQLAEARSQLEDLKLVLHVTEEKYQAMIDEAKQEIDHYKDVTLRNDLELQTLRADWEEKELNFVGCIKRSEEEIEILKGESDKLFDSLKVSESEAKMAREEVAEVQNSLNQVKDEVASVKEALEHATRENLQLKEILHDKENELARAILENEDLHASGAAFQEKIEDLSKQLAGKTSPRAEKDGQEVFLDEGVDVLRKIDFADETSDEKINEQSILLVSPSDVEMHHETIFSVDVDPGHVKAEPENSDENGKDDSDSVDVEVSKWENCKISDKGSSPKSHGHEAVDEDFDSKVDCDGLDQMNGLVSESAENGANMLQKPEHKKKKALLHKFGGLLKKKGSHK